MNKYLNDKLTTVRNIKGVKAKFWELAGLLGFKHTHKAHKRGDLKNGDKYGWLTKRGLRVKT